MLGLVGRQRVALLCGSLLACQRPAVAQRGASPSPATPTQGLAAPALAREAQSEPELAFPHRPAGCDYDVPAVVPNHTRTEAHSDRSGPAPQPRAVHLTSVASPATSIVVQWSTDEQTLASEVRFGSAPERLERVAQGYSFRYAGAPGRRQHEVHLCGLEPGRTWYYDAGGSAARSAVVSFNTAPAGPEEVRILVAGDARTHPEVWGALSRLALEQRPDVLFFSGDVTASGSSQRLWDQFFDEGRELLARVPIFIADGNHDDPSTVYHAQFALPSNGSPSHHESWYRVSYGPVELLVLNDSTVPPSVVTGPQTQWLERSLSQVDRGRTPWVVAMHHQPMYTTAVGHLPDLVTRGAWEPLFDRFHVDVDLAGHVHNYESLLPLRGGHPTDPARGTTRFTFGGAGAPLYPFRERQPWTRTRESTHGWALLVASASALQWTAYRLDGTTIETLRWGR